MDYPELGIIGLRFDEEYFEFHGVVQLGGVKVALHFPLRKSASEKELLTRHRHRGKLIAATSQFDRLLEEAQAQVASGDILPPVSALIVYDDGFDLHFGSSNPAHNELWYEAMYNLDGYLYLLEKHLPEGA